MMKDFTFRNDTRLFFCNDIRETITNIVNGKKIMLVYGSGSIKRNECHADITEALAQANVPFLEYGGSSREMEKIEEGIRTAKANGVTMIVGVGISYIKNVLEATRTLQTHPDDLDARGIIMLGASLSTSSRLGIGKVEPFAYDIYELEFLPEVLFGSTYRRSLTSIFPHFLNIMGRHHEKDVRRYFFDAFGYYTPIEESSRKLSDLFASFGVPLVARGLPQIS